MIIVIIVYIFLIVLTGDYALNEWIIIKYGIRDDELSCRQWNG